ncbi:SDR family NAD(P)-dependent oxidoreductase [Rhizobium viscosum]|uniref:NAD(P)-dependent dehydrogenase (Short-subunit alcohol dehydrogenase family) n=1 Tax=Rhizobium viscosum TaxID=1673 RepID=A0ABR9IWS4_RHIVS|nr:SDR family NAD(P)-dependent oxidoreductase [Rhizobium viscosum]MBE1507673.1 NAD(P)-dependent dehydrogenase (short-subunit alcohol dehydrogenase family) [Rhizobium viscosum]
MSLQEMFNVSDKSAIVTGGASGLGRAYAEVLADGGARVCIFDMNQNELDRTVEELSRSNGNVWGMRVDVTDRPAMSVAFDQVAKRHGRIDVVFANAGIDAGPGFLTPDGDRNPDGEIDNLDDHHWDEVITTNLTSVYNTIKLAARHMKRTGGGRIIATSSVAALYNDGIVGTPYMPAKAGVAHLVRQAAMELGRHRILVNAIAPGPFITNIAGGRMRFEEDRKAFSMWSALGRVAETSEIKGLALYLASPASSYVTGAHIVIDGGLVLRPAEDAIQFTPRAAGGSPTM